MKNILTLSILASIAFTSCKKEENKGPETVAVGYFIEMPITPTSGNKNFVKITYATGNGQTKDTTIVGPDAKLFGVFVDNFPVGNTAIMKIETDFEIGKHTITADIEANGSIIASGDSATKGKSFTISANVEKK